MTAPRTAILVSKPASPHQRQYTRILVRELDLPTDVITLLHRRFYESARVPFPVPGMRFDDALGELTFAHAANLITVLRREHVRIYGAERGS